MNIQLCPPGLSYVTQAAEGLARWTVTEIEAIVQAGSLMWMSVLNSLMGKWCRCSQRQFVMKSSRFRF
jgi:hypothetical protein